MTGYILGILIGIVFIALFFIGAEVIETSATVDELRAALATLVAPERTPQP